MAKQNSGIKYSTIVKIFWIENSGIKISQVTQNYTDQLLRWSVLPPFI
jgi:hypothetical protein